MNVNTLGVRNSRTTGGVSGMRGNSKNEFASMVETSIEKQEREERRQVSASEGNLDSQSLKTAWYQEQLRSEKVEAKRGVEESIVFTGSYQERLEQLQKLNAETDWASMSDVEKVKTFEERYYKAFGGQKLFLTACMYVPFSKQHQEIYDGYLKEIDKYLGKDGVSPLKSQYSACYREAYYGNMNDREVRAAIQEKWKGADSLEDKYAFVTECFWAGVGGKGEDLILDQIQREVYKKVDGVLSSSMGGAGKAVSNHPRFAEYFMTYAKGVGDGAGFTLNWKEITQSVIEGFERASQQGGENVMSPEDLEELRGLMDDFLADLIEGER